MRLWTVLNELIQKTKSATTAELISGSVTTPRTVAPSVFNSAVSSISSSVPATSPTATISATTGTLSSATARQWGNVVELRITFQNSSTTTTGQNVFAGTLSTTSLRPAMVSTGVGYFGARSLVGQITAAGAILVRNTNADTFPSVTGTSTASVTFTYVI